MQIRWPATIAFIFVTMFAHADSLELRDGRHLQGKYIGGTSDVLAFSAEGSTQYFAVGEVLALVFGGTQNNSLWGQPSRQRRPQAGIQPEKQKAARATGPGVRVKVVSDRQAVRSAGPKYSFCKSGAQGCL